VNDLKFWDLGSENPLGATRSIAISCVRHESSLPGIGKIHVEYVL
jgi:hypothetical protein